MMLSGLSPSISVLNHDAACTWLRSSANMRVFSRATASTASKTPHIFVLVSASRLLEVADFVRAANKAHRLEALLVHEDVDSRWIGQMLDRAELRTLRNLIVHRDDVPPRRVLNAWQIGAQDELVADAVALHDGLLVLSCAMRRIEVPWSELQKLSRVDTKDWGELVVSDDGSYVHWPGPDIHVDFGAMLAMVDPEARAAANIERVRRQEGFGAAVMALRRAAGLTQERVDGVTARQIRRIESGEVFPRLSTLEKLARAHGMSTDGYIDALAREQAGFHSMQSPGQAGDDVKGPGAPDRADAPTRGCADEPPPRTPSGSRVAAASVRAR